MSELDGLSKAKTVGLVACGALAREIQAVIKANGFSHMEVRFLPAKLHNSPKEIPGAVDAALGALAPLCDSLLVGYGDCGTVGQLDKVLEKHNATRIEGAHCYAFFAGLDAFGALSEAEPGTFYLTDYLARQFETLVIKPLGLDRHPELRDAYFGNYTRLLYLAQSQDQELTEKAKSAAKRLGLRFERIDTGFGGIATFLEAAA